LAIFFKDNGELVIMDLAAATPLSTAGPIPSPISRVARPTASPIRNRFSWKVGIFC